MANQVAKISPQDTAESSLLTPNSNEVHHQIDQAQIDQPNQHQLYSPVQQAIMDFLTLASSVITELVKVLDNLGQHRFLRLVGLLIIASVFVTLFEMDSHGSILLLLPTLAIIWTSVIMFKHDSRRFSLLILFLVVAGISVYYMHMEYELEVMDRQSRRDSDRQLHERMMKRLEKDQ